VKIKKTELETQISDLLGDYKFLDTKKIQKDINESYEYFGEAK
jgi:hypothetical protein